MLKPAYLAPDERHLLARFWRSASGFWRGPKAWRAWLLAVLLVATVLLQLVTQYGLNFWNRDFFNAIGRKDADELVAQALRFIPLAAASLFLTVLSVWARMTMQRTWRSWLSTHLYDYWLDDDRYTRLRFVIGDHEAPEFRIAEDARLATDLPVDLALGLLNSLLTVITFIGVLWSVGGSLAIQIDSVSLIVPGYLVIAVIAYSLLLSATTILIASHLTRVMQENKRAEAELRSTGTHLRESGEGLAQPDAARSGRHTIGAALKAVIAIWRIYCWQLMRLTLVTYTSLLVTPVIGLLLCLPKYLAGTMTLGEVVQAAAAFVVVQGAFNWFTENYAKLAEWASSANRVASLLLALDEVDASGPASDRDSSAAAQGPNEPPRIAGQTPGADQPTTRSSPVSRR